MKARNVGTLTQASPESGASIGVATARLSGTPLERIARLREVIIKGGDEAQHLRRLPADTVEALIDEGMFRFAMPTELGGENASAVETVKIIEAMAAIDASVAWNVMLGSEINAMAAGGMPKALAKEVFIDNPRTIMCGGGGPGTTASYAIAQKDGSVKVWGEATFISGCHNADWCFLGAPLVKEGEEHTANPLAACGVMPSGQPTAGAMLTVGISPGFGAGSAGLAPYAACALTVALSQEFRTIPVPAKAVTKNTKSTIFAMAYPLVAKGQRCLSLARIRKLESLLSRPR